MGRSMYIHYVKEGIGEVIVKFSTIQELLFIVESRGGSGEFYIELEEDLSDDEIKSLQDYMNKKYAELAKAQ